MTTLLRPRCDRIRLVAVAALLVFGCGRVEPELVEDPRPAAVATPELAPVVTLPAAPTSPPVPTRAPAVRRSTGLPARFGHLPIVAEGAVLDTDAAAVAPHADRLEVLEQEGLLVVRGRLPSHHVPRPARALLGRTLQLYTGPNPVCTVTVTGFDVLVRLGASPSLLDPGEDDGQADDADSEAAEEADGPDAEAALDGTEPQPETGLAERAWAAEDAQKLLLAHFERPDGCDGATWARPIDLPRPELVTAEPARGAWRTALLGGLGLVADVDLVLVRGQNEAWLLADLGDRRVLWRATGDLAHPLRLRYEARGTAVETDEDGESLDVVGAADLDGDGRLELLTPDGLLRGHLDAVERVEAPEPWYGDEGC